MIRHILREDISPNLNFPLPDMPSLVMVGRALCGSRIFQVSPLPIGADCGTCLRIARKILVEVA